MDEIKEKSIDMEKTDTKRYKVFKIIFILLSVIVVVFALTGNVLTSKEGGAVHLASFESFYVYIVAVVFAIYRVIKNENANVIIVCALLSYLWTYYLVQQMINYFTTVNIIVEPYFYIYLSSAIFLIISLFFNDKKKVDDKKEIDKNVSIDSQGSNNMANNLIFASFILGLKGIPLNTEVLLVNNIPDNSLDLIYAIGSSNNQTLKLPINTIKDISYKTSMRMQNVSKKVESNEARSMLLSAVVFGGNPLLQLAGNSAFNSVFDELSNNYDKVNFDAYYEITIETVYDGEEVKFILNTDTNPEEFIKQIQNRVI